MGVFLTGYGIARFVVEFVRQPDAQFVSEGNPVGSGPAPRAATA